MVLRIEYILLISLTVLSFFIFIEKPKSIDALESNCTKELLFEDLHLLDINQNGVENELKATNVVKYKSLLEAKDVNITHEDIYHVEAKKATYQKDIISIEQNITLKKDNYLEFKTDALVYNIKQKLASSRGGFIMEINGSKIKGDTLKYDLNNQEIQADKIKATLVIDG